MLTPADKRWLGVWLAATVATLIASAFLTRHANAATHPRCTHANVTVGERGRCAHDANWLLGGHRPSKFRSPYYRKLGVRVPTGSVYKVRSAKATRRLKYRLGYACGPRDRHTGHCKLINGAFGPTLRYMLISGHRPFRYKQRSGNRRGAYEQAQKKVRAQSSLSKKQQLLVYYATTAINHNGFIGYSQAFRAGLQYPWPPFTHYSTTDCAGFVTSVYWRAFGGAAYGDPSGYGFRYVGWGGSIANSSNTHLVWRRGQSLNRLHVGDIIMYGYSWPYSHTVMLIDRAHLRVASHGSDLGPVNDPLYYRGDVYGAWRLNALG